MCSLSLSLSLSLKCCRLVALSATYPARPREEESRRDLDGWLSKSTWRKDDGWREGGKKGRRSDGGGNCNFFDGRVVRLTSWLLLLLCLLTVCVLAYLLQGDPLRPEYTRRGCVTEIISEC